MAVPVLHRVDASIAALGPWPAARRYWRGNDPELDVVARSVDGERLLIGEVKWSLAPLRAPEAAAAVTRLRVATRGLPWAREADVTYALFVPEVTSGLALDADAHVVDARAVLSALR